MPETVYSRKIISSTQGTENEKNRASDPIETLGSAERGIQREHIAMKSYTHSLRVFSGKHNTGENPWMHIWRPFALLASPTVLVRIKFIKSSMNHNSNVVS